ncbi:hypothetical protein Tco_0790158 [Tanacetum coccineum]
MHEDFKYVESLEKEIDELESDKADFSNMYDLLLQECVSKDVMCSYLHSLSDLDAHTELQCLYLHKVKECECLAQKLSKQTESVNEKVYNELSRIWKEKESNVFLKEREQYHEIQDLKAQLQDKNIAISELKKLIAKLKGKGVDTNFKQQSILGKPPLQPIRNQPVSPRESVGSNDMVHNYYLEEAKKYAQLQKDKDLKSKPSVITHERLPNTASGCKPKPRVLNQQSRNWPASMSSQVSNNDVPKAGKPRKQKPFLKSKYLPCPTCKKCIYSANHDECILKYLSKIPIGQKFSPNKSFAVYLKTTPPRSGLTWKPMGKFFTNVCLRWIPTEKLFDSYTSKVVSEPKHGSNVDIPNIHECKQTVDISAGTSLSGQQKQRIDFCAGTSFNVKQENLKVWLLKKLISQKPVPKWFHKR